MIVKAFIGPLVMISIAVIKYQEKNQLKWKGFILTYKDSMTVHHFWKSG